uniref:Histone H2B/H2A n=1 Tax=Clandestinovirus TaxID=2831644 RepID=A0A8F8PKF6_9VIRU|nr:histone H2B/H2A [Clandestinovirus]
MSAEQQTPNTTEQTEQVKVDETAPQQTEVKSDVKTEEKKTKKGRKSNSQQMTRFVRKVLKVLNGDAQVSKESCQMVNAIIVGKVEEIGNICALLLRDSTHKKTLKLNTLEAALSIHFKDSKEILKRALAAGALAVQKHSAYVPVKEEGKKTATPKNASKKALLQLPVKRIGKLLRTFTNVPQMSQGVSVFLTGAMEYYATELFINALEKCNNDGKKIISPRHFPLGLQADAEMQETLQDAILGCGTGHGVIPGIVPAVEKNAYKKALLEKEQGMIDEIPADLVAQEKKRVQKLKESKKRKAAEATGEEKAAKKQKVAEASA